MQQKTIYTVSQLPSEILDLVFQHLSAVGKMLWSMQTMAARYEMLLHYFYFSIFFYFFAVTQVFILAVFD